MHLPAARHARQCFWWAQLPGKHTGMHCWVAAVLPSGHELAATAAASSAAAALLPPTHLFANQRPPRPLAALQGVTDASRKPLTAADGAARVLHPLLAWTSGRLPDDQLANVLVWKDFLPLRVLPAAKPLLAGLQMHPLAATLREGPRQPAAAARCGGAAPASVGRLEVVQVAEGQHKVSWGPPECMCNVSNAVQAPCRLAIIFARGSLGRHDGRLWLARLTPSSAAPHPAPVPAGVHGGGQQPA